MEINWCNRWRVVLWSYIQGEDEPRPVVVAGDQWRELVRWLKVASLAFRYIFIYIIYFFINSNLFLSFFKFILFNIFIFLSYFILILLITIKFFYLFLSISFIFKIYFSQYSISFSLFLLSLIIIYFVFIFVCLLYFTYISLLNTCNWIIIS